MMILKQNANLALEKLDLTPRHEETLRIFLCRLLDWVFNQDELIEKLPWYIPTHLIKWAIRRMLECDLLDPECK